MDKEDYFKILQEFCCYNLDNYITDREWTSHCCISHVEKNDDIPWISDTPSDNQTNLSLNVSTFLDAEDPALEEKIKKENCDMIISNSFDYASNVKTMLNDYHDRKISLFENIVKSHATCRVKYNKLLFHYNPNAEKYVSKDFGLSDIDLSKWPGGLDDLLDKIGALEFDEVFYNQFDMDGNFHISALQFINSQFDELLKLTAPNEEIEAWVIKAIIITLSLKILEGDFTKFFLVLKSFQDSFCKNKDLFNKLFHQALSQCSEGASQNIVLGRINGLLEIMKENNGQAYPIMRNYSIVDYYNISKHILFSSDSKGGSCSVATDSEYLYIMLSGTCGGLLKVGSGYGDTVKGKVYQYQQEFQYYQNPQIVYVKNKIYLKASKIGSQISDFGLIFIIDPDTLTIESGIFLQFPELTQHESVIEINNRFVLLGDDNNLYALILEPVISENKTESTLPPRRPFLTNPKQFTRGKDSKWRGSTTENNVSHINLMFYTFPAGGQRKTSVESSGHLCLFQTKVHEMPSRNECLEFSCVPNSPFDSTKFDCLRWSLIGGKIIGYNLNEGACVIFSGDSSNEKEFKYSYQESKLLEAMEKKSRYYGPPGFGESGRFNNNIKAPDDEMRKYNMKDFKEIQRNPLFSSRYENQLSREDSSLQYYNPYANNSSPRNNLIFLKKPEGGKYNKLSLSNISNDKIPTESTGPQLIQEPEEVYNEKLSEEIQPEKERDAEKHKESEPTGFMKAIGGLKSFFTRFTKKEDHDKDKDKEPNENVQHPKKLAIPQSDIKPCDDAPKKGRTNLFTEKTTTSKTGRKKVEKKKQKEIPIEDTVKGTLIKVLPAIQSSTLPGNAHAFCYDPVNQVYYIISESMISITVLVSSTFEEKSDQLKQMAFNATQISLEGLMEYFNTNISMDYEAFYRNMTALVVYLHCRKEDNLWRYKNWNYFYSNLLYHDGIEDPRSYEHRLFPREHLEKSIAYKIEKEIWATGNHNANALLDQLPEELVNNFTIVPKAYTNAINPKRVPNLSVNDCWGSWDNDSALLLEGNYQKCSDLTLEKIVNTHIYIDNRRQVFHAIDGEESSLDIILSELTEAVCNMDECQVQLVLMLVYLWVENANHIPLLDMNRTSGISLREKLIKLKILLKEIMGINKFVKFLVFKILILGWDVLCSDLESQLEWFYEFYKQSEHITPISLSPYIELNILRLGSDPKLSPFAVLLQKLSLNSSLCLVNNFSRIHAVKSYFITTIQDVKDINSTKKKIVMIPKVYSINPHNICFPFYWVMIGSSMKTYLPNTNNTTQSTGTCSQTSMKKISSIMNVEEDYDNYEDKYNNTYAAEIAKLAELGILDSQEGEDILNTAYFKTKDQVRLPGMKQALNPLDKNLLVSKAETDEQMIMKQTLREILNNYTISFAAGNNTEAFLKKMSEQMWSFLQEKLVPNDENQSQAPLLSFLNDSFFMSLGDLQEYSQYNNNPLSASITELINQHFSLLSTLIQHSRNFNMNLLQRYAFAVMNSFYSNSISCPISNLLQAQQHISDAFKTIISSTIFTLDDGQQLFDKQTLLSFSSSGYQIEKQKVLEYNIGSELVPIIEKIQFPGSSIIAVEIELKQNDSSRSIENYSLVIASHEDISLQHQAFDQREMPSSTSNFINSYPRNDLSLRYSIGNNYKDIGTMFTFQLVPGPVKRLFLIGDEVKIFSRSEMDYGGYERHEEMKMKNKISKDKIPLNDRTKALLTIKCYPCNYMKIETLEGKHDQRVEDPIVQNWMELVSDMKYFTTKIYSKMIKSVEISEGKSEMSILQEPIFRLGFSHYRHNEEFWEKFIQSQPLISSQRVDAYSLFEQKDKRIDESIFNFQTIWSFPFPNEILADVKALLTELETLYSHENHEVKLDNIAHLSNILTYIRSNLLLQEPQSYKIIKFIQLFPKSTWKLFELSFCLCLLYHMSSDQEFHNFDIADINPHLQLELTVIGKKLNSILNWMSIRVQKLKSTYDCLKNYITGIIDTIEHFKANLLSLMVDQILLKINEGSSSSLSLSSSLPDQSVDYVKQMPLSELIQLYPQIFEDYAGQSVLKEIVKKEKEKIKADLNETYSENAQSLKDACEMNGLHFNEANLQGALKGYTDYIFAQIHEYIQLEDIHNYITCNINRDLIFTKLRKNSPYLKIPLTILERLFFLMSFNKISQSESFQSVPELNKTAKICSNTTPSITRTKSKINKDEEEKIFPPHHVILLKSLCNFLSDDKKISEIVRLLNLQHIRYKLRDMGLQLMEQDMSLNKSAQILFGHLFGAISSSVKGSLCHGIDTVPLKFKSIVLSSFMDFMINAYNHQLSLFSSVTGDKLNYVMKNLSLIAGDINVLLKIHSILPPYMDPWEKTILASFKCLLNLQPKNQSMLKMKSELLDNLGLLVSKVVEQNKSIANTIMECCSDIVESQIISKESIDTIITLLQFMKSLAFYVQVKEDESIVAKISQKLLDIAITTDSPVIIKYVCTIVKIIFKSCSSSSFDSTINLEKCYEKVGKLVVFDCQTSNVWSGVNRYRVMIQMNSRELDYQFLVNALYYWEEAFPTQLSLYKYDEEFFEYVSNDQNSLEKIPLQYNIENNPIISCRVPNIKFEPYLNRLKSSISKTEAMMNVTKKRLETIRKSYETLKKDKEHEDENFLQLHKMKIDMVYLSRILTHISDATIIGETACAIGYIVIDCILTYEQAERFAELVHKAQNKLLPMIPLDLESSENIFTEKMIYPEMPREEELIKGCTNVLKETTPIFMNVTIIHEEAYQKLNLNIINKNTKNIIDYPFLSGRSVSLIIDSVLSLVYYIYSSELRSWDIINRVKTELNNLVVNKTVGKNYHLISLLLVLSGGYRSLRINSQAMMNHNTNDQTCRIIQGGHKTGKSTSLVLLNEKSCKIEEVSTCGLEKVERNSHLLKMISLADLMEPLIIANDLVKSDPTEYHILLRHLLLKLIKEKRNSEGEIAKILNGYKDESSTVFKFLVTMKELCNEIQWVGGTLSSWEIDFVEAFERLYDRGNPTSQLIFSPMFFNSMISLNRSAEKTVSIIDTSNADLVTQYVLPESTYLSQLPKISDFTKSYTALKNVQIFDKVIVNEVLPGNRVDPNAVPQIRYYLLSGMFESARTDLEEVFGRHTFYKSYIKDEFDMKEITKEECFPGNFYLANINHQLIREVGIKTLMKFESMEKLQVPVVLLFNDNVMNQAFVLYYDDEYGTMHSFWIRVENLLFPEIQLKVPANSFKVEYLMKEFAKIASQLSVIYAKKALLHIIEGFLLSSHSVSSFEELYSQILLYNWEKFKTDPEGGVFRTFRSFFLVKQTQIAETEIMLNKRATSKICYMPKQNDILALAQQEDQGTMQIESADGENSFAIADALNDVIFSEDSSSKLFTNLVDWCIFNWSNIHNLFARIHVDLFNEYSVNLNDSTIRSESIFSQGNFSERLLALHELCPLESGNYSGIVISFEKGAYVGPQAKVSFYTDPYGENLAYEMIAIKLKKDNLESIVFPHAKIWMGYKPGTTIFYRTLDIVCDQSLSRDSHLPCCVTFIPYIWPTLIYFTDLSTNMPFTNHPYGENENILSKFIIQLFRHCVSLAFPVEIQRRIFSITNRVILKAIKYLPLSQQDAEKSIESKIAYIGVEPVQVIRLIQNISTLNETIAEKSFSSGYIVEGVELIISLLSALKESFASFNEYLLNSFNYALPKWMEAIIKLGQFLSFLQGNSNLEKSLVKEIEDELDISSQFERMIVIQNISHEISDEVIQCEVTRLLRINNAKVVDIDKDIQIFVNKSKEKSVVILIDGFVIDKIFEKSEAYFKEVKGYLANSVSFMEMVGKKMKMLKSDIINSQVLTNTNPDYLINIFQGEDLCKCLHQNEIGDIVNNYFKLRLEAYLKEREYMENNISTLECLYPTGIVKSQCEVLRKMLEDKSVNETLDLIGFYEALQSQGIDFWLEAMKLASLSMNKEIQISIMEKIREIVDLSICKEKPISIIFPSQSLRFVPNSFNSINHTTTDLLTGNFAEMRTIPLFTTRYYWTIIKYFNICLVEALPFISPPDAFSKKDNVPVEEGYIAVHLPKTISTFLSTARGITLSHVKSNLIEEIISISEFDNELIQIPTFHFERMTVADNVEKRKIIQKKHKPEMLEEEEEEDVSMQIQMDKDKDVDDMKEDESLFLQAYHQAKGVDPAFFRSKKIEGYHAGFKVQFNKEDVQGVSGPYRQFFSDIFLELQESEGKGSMKSLKLLCPTSNHIAKKGEFKDKFTINPSYKTLTALSHYEFLGMLMGICIRTGVYLPLDLCSIVWKKIVNEPILIEDIIAFDEGLYEQMKALESEQTEFENIFTQNFVIHLTDDTKIELKHDGEKVAVNYDNRYQYMQLALKARLTEADPQIEMIRKGLFKMIPKSLLNCKYVLIFNSLVLTHRELERLVCGVKAVDINLLRVNTKVSENITDDRVKWLWEILNEFPQEEKVKFVKFCWAQERLPPTQEVYHKKQVMFTIKPDMGAKDNLPSADTCFFAIALPEYSSKEIMKKMISIAISIDNVGMNGDKVKQSESSRRSPEDYINRYIGMRGLRGRRFNYGHNEEESDE